MIISWMVYGALVATMIAIAAASADALLRLARRPVRAVWGVALVTTVAVIAFAPRTHVTEIVVPTASIASAHTPARAQPLPMWRGVSRAVVRTLDAYVTVPLRAGITGAAHVLPAWTERWLGAAWFGAGALLVLLFLMVQLRFRRARRSWPSAQLHGVRVRVSPEAGPAVIGLSKPEIVVPRWLLGRGDDEQRLVLAHEVEHLRAGDPIVLALGWLAVALVPWNPAVWWMVSRLRLAVELDCDARVLRGGAAARSYGMLLIDLAEYCSGLRVGAPALADDASHLHQRLTAMKPDRPNFLKTRASVIALLAASAVVVACEAKLPTSADIDKMDVASAEQGVKQVMVLKAGRYTIDGVAATPEQAHALDGKAIATINIVKGANGDEINITTRKGADIQATEREALRANGNGPMVYRKRSPERAGTESTFVAGMERMQSFTGLVFVNGVKSDPSAIKTLDRNSIKSVQVLKGKAAAERYNDPAAANGVIEITTKTAGAPK